ncbi:hypothetical protein PCANC_11688 [Puccinia coronata f. sp. avenae]|uniref:Uncharacterized protein n=1 Tax=Puccinia coronata f. sp. avenae TaxID=200324 RepID=A0A2N5VXG7_9BASI|nr:hypothetical protein PCANC_11688 [Puccinia coronata f. sp. avenae]
MAADTRWKVPGTRWRVPVVCTGTCLRIPGAGAGFQASQKLNTRVPSTSQPGNQLGGAGCAAGPDHACLRSKTAAERRCSPVQDRMLLRSAAAVLHSTPPTTGYASLPPPPTLITFSTPLKLVTP